MAINDPKVIKKWPTYYNPYTFKEFLGFFNIYVVGQGDQQRGKVGQGDQQNDKIGHTSPQPHGRWGSPDYWLQIM